MPGTPFVRRRRTRGQALVEFALVAPVLILILAGIIQFGLIFWAQNTLNQVARDTGRWAASQQVCSTGPVVTTANDIAANSALLGYSSAWASAASATAPGVFVQFSDPCPPANNSQVSWVDITINHQVPIFFPWVPGDGHLSTSTQFRMEPAP